MSIEAKVKEEISSVTTARPIRAWIAPRNSLLYYSRKRRLTLIIVSGVALALTLVVCVGFGAVAVPVDKAFTIIWNHTFGLIWSLPADYTQGHDTIIWQIRLPRLLLAGCVGAGLAASGAIYQGLFRNPLADPYLVGVAQGAAVGAVMAIVLPFPLFLYTGGIVQWAAFVMALLTVALVYNLARIGGEVRNTTLLLAGVAVGSLCAAVTTFLTYLHNDKLSTIYGWLLGSFNTAGSWDNVWKTAPYLVFGSLVMLLLGRRLNALQMGDEQALQLGVNVRLVKGAMIVASSLMAASAVSAAGIIGFVGLIVPHAVRLLTGQDYRLLLPLSLLWGAIFMIVTDSVSRTLLSPTEIPVSVITAFFGGPFFIYILRKKRTNVE